MSDTRIRDQDAPIGVLLMAYGTPETPDQVEAYFTHIRGGRVPSPEAVEHLKHRYELVGGRTPLLAITEAARGGAGGRAEQSGPGHATASTPG